MKAFSLLSMVMFATASFGATAAQRQTWQAALNGKSGDKAFSAIYDIKQNGKDDAGVIPMLISAMTRKEKSTGGDVSTTVGAEACALVGTITKYPVFPDISCRHVDLAGAQQAWLAWLKPRKAWTVSRMQADAQDKRQRLLRSSRPDEALRGLNAALAFETDEADVKKLLARFAGDLQITLAKKSAKSSVITVRNAGKNAAIYAVDQNFCDISDNTTQAANAGKGSVVIPAACPVISPSFPTFTYTEMLKPGQSRSYQVKGAGSAYRFTDDLRKKDYIATLSK